MGAMRAIGLHGLGAALILVVLARLWYLLTWRKKSIRNKLVLITGAGGGIGRFEALEFAKQGAHLVLLDINEKGVEDVAAEVRAKYPTTRVHTYGGLSQADISDRHVVYRLKDKIKAECGRVYCLVNNAGIVTGTPLLDTPDERIIKTFEVNTLAHFWTVKAFLPDMLQANDGHIVTIASIAGFFAAPQMVDYAASKFAARGFSEGLRMELRKMGKTGVRCSTICPGHIKTELFKGFSMTAIPSLEPAYVGKKVVDSILRDREVVVLPHVGYYGAALKNILPTHWMDTINEISGMSTAMSGWNPQHANMKLDAMASKQ